MHNASLPSTTPQFHLVKVLVLKTEFRNRKFHKAIRIRLEAMPLRQHIEDGHRECQTRGEVFPDAVTDFFEMTNVR